MGGGGGANVPVQPRGLPLNKASIALDRSVQAVPGCATVKVELTIT